MQVYAPPEGIGKPDFMPFEGYSERCKAYEKQIIDFCKANSKSKWAGKPVRFQVADGYATYYVFKLSPLILILDESGDAYEFPYVDRLTVSDIKEQIARQEKLAALFGH